MKKLVFAFSPLCHLLEHSTPSTLVRNRADDPGCNWCPFQQSTCRLLWQHQPYSLSVGRSFLLMSGVYQWLSWTKAGASCLCTYCSARNASLYDCLSWAIWAAFPVLYIVHTFHAPMWVVVLVNSRIFSSAASWGLSQRSFPSWTLVWFWILVRVSVTL